MSAKKKLFIFVVIAAFTTFLTYSAFAQVEKSKPTESVESLVVPETQPVIPVGRYEKYRHGDRRPMHHRYSRRGYRRGRRHYGYDDSRFIRRRGRCFYRHGKSHFIRRRHRSFAYYGDCIDCGNCRHHRRGYGGHRRHYKYHNPAVE